MVDCRVEETWEFAPFEFVEIPFDVIVAVVADELVVIGKLLDGIERITPNTTNITINGVRARAIPLSPVRAGIMNPATAVINPGTMIKRKNCGTISKR